MKRPPLNIVIRGSELDDIRKTGVGPGCQRCGHGINFHTGPRGCRAPIDIAATVSCSCPILLNATPCSHCNTKVWTYDPCPICFNGAVWSPATLGPLALGPLANELAELKAEVAALRRSIVASRRQPRYYERCGFCGGSGYVDKRIKF